MITVPQAVREVIHETPFLEELLSGKLLNLSEVARDIKLEIEEKTMKDVQIGSIIMALKRMSAEFRPNTELTKIFKSSPDLIVRSNLFSLTIHKSDSQIHKQKILLEYAALSPTVFMTVTHGVFEVTIVAHNEMKDYITTLYKEENVIARSENLSSITVKFSKDIIDIPGIYYIILKALAWGGIDITEVVSTYSEITIILKQEYVDKAFSLIKKLFKTK